MRIAFFAGRWYCVVARSNAVFTGFGGGIAPFFRAVLFARLGNGCANGN